MIQLLDKKFKPYILQGEINQAVNKIAEEIDRDYHDKSPLLIGVLNGAFIFASDLCRDITLDIEITFVRLKSYVGTVSSGDVQSIIGLQEKIEDRDIIIVEDIVDTGNTLVKFIPLLKESGATSVKIAALLFKPQSLQHPLTVDYVGFEIPNTFVVGYGLDYEGLGRNWKDIHQLADENV